MNGLQLFIFVMSIILAACAPVDQHGTIGQLRTQQIEITEEEISGGLDEAIAGYQQFLEETQDSVLAPEAIRRLADLKVEKEYGFIEDQRSEMADSATLPAPEPASRSEISLQAAESSVPIQDETEDRKSVV